MMADAECKRQVEAMAIRMKEEAEARARGERLQINAQVARLLAELNTICRSLAALESEHIAQRAEHTAAREQLAAALVRIDELTPSGDSELDRALRQLAELREEVVQAKATLGDALRDLGISVDENKSLTEQLQVTHTPAR
jgi:chromosome segregation ATPase